MEKFWSDDFDMDLLKLFPELPKMLGETAERALWTVGHTTHGRLNHPACWNSHGAFAWTHKPNLKRDPHGWFNVMGCVSDAEEIECTWLELLRDQWPHGYGFILLPQQSMFVPPPRGEFEKIMYDLRGWIKDEHISIARCTAMAWILHANRQLEAECERGMRQRA
jgi:hypothetical protein